MLCNLKSQEKHLLQHIIEIKLENSDKSLRKYINNNCLVHLVIVCQYL